MILKIFLYLISVIFILIIPQKILAGSSSIILSEPNPSNITDVNQEYQVKVSLSINTSDGTIYYLRGVFYKEGSSNYCGLTWNGNSWSSGPYSTNEGWKNFLPVTIASSSAQTLLKAKIDTEDSGCKESGNYNFKVQRFTQGGSGKFDSQNEQTVSVVIPTPTLTPIPTVKPKIEFTSKPKSIESGVTKHSSEIVISPTKIIVIELSPTQSVVTNQSTLESKVLSEAYNVSESTDSVMQEKENNQERKGINISIVIFLILSGTGFILAAIITSYKRIRDK